MILPLSAVSTHVYTRVAKPLLFHWPPDTVHEQMLRFTLKAQSSGLMRRTIHGIWAYDNPALLSQTIAGVTFPNPIGLSAGFDNNFRLAPMLKSIGFGFMEGGSATMRPYAGNPRPWFYRLPKTKSLVVNKGLANDGIEAIVNRIQSYGDNVFEHFPLNISVAKTNDPHTCSEKEAIADFVGSLQLLKAYGVGSLITINTSCPNASAGELFTKPQRLDHLLSTIDDLGLEQPIFLKMPSDLNWKEFTELVDIAASHHVTGLTIHNLVKDRASVDLKDVLPDSVKGNLSGKPAWDSSNALVARTRQTYGDRFTIVGVGGVFSADNAYTKITLGADLVELITGLIFEGPALIGQINYGLAKRLKQDGFTNIQQAVGSRL